nr:hypothetical protein [Dysgonomonas gadei]
MFSFISKRKQWTGPHYQPPVHFNPINPYLLKAVITSTQSCLFIPSAATTLYDIFDWLKSPSFPSVGADPLGRTLAPGDMVM